MLKENIKSIRKSKGLSQEELAIKLNDDDLKVISEKLEIINLQLSQSKSTMRKIINWSLILLCAIIVIISIDLILLNSPYLNWDYNNPENAAFGVLFHIFEWLFIRVAPIILIGVILGIFLIRKKE